MTARSTKKKAKEPVEDGIVIELTDEDFVLDREQTTGTFDMRQYYADEKTPVMEPAAFCPFCHRWVIFRWIWSDYRFSMHAEPEMTGSFGEMPGDKDCLGSFRPVAQPIRPTRQPLFLRDPVL